MRDHRTIPGSSVANWSYYHDGQTTAEDEQILTGNLTVTRYGLGARGIDECERQTGTVVGGQHNLTSSTSVWYPVYDGHGNQCGTLSRGLNNTYTLANVRTFDAWGNVRRGNGTGDPASRYCGNLGHVQDDESLLVYMRARFYDPAAGRFESEDTDHAHSNWTLYCGNDPINRSDSSGCDFQEATGWWALGSLFALTAILLSGDIIAAPNTVALAGAIATAALAIACFAAAYDACPLVTNVYGSQGGRIQGLLATALGAFSGMLVTIMVASGAGLQTCADVAVAACCAYDIAVMGALLDQYTLEN
jgi:RHS repeat-associated protein